MPTGRAVTKLPEETPIRYDLYRIPFNNGKGGRPVPLEGASGNGMSNMRGTIAMARTGDPHSANSQFFINLVDNNRLDPGNNRWGYTVFGNVIEGMEVVDQIATAKTGPQGKLRSDVPVVPIVIKKMSRVTYD